MKDNSFQSLLQKFFLDRLINQMKASPCTIQTYKYTFRLLLKYMSFECNLTPDIIRMEDISADRICGFLNYLEKSRNNSAKSINNRLAAIKSFGEYVSYECPEYLDIIRKIKMIPFRKVIKKVICYLTREEIDCILESCNLSTNEGKRDYMMILLLYNTGMRVSEMLNLKGKDVETFGRKKFSVRIMGKGRKERIVPLWSNTCEYLNRYIKDNKIENESFIMSGRNVEHLTRSGVRYRLDTIVRRATSKCQSLETKTITPHVFRHSTAMGLLQSGVDLSTIAIWLGHESIETTHKYMVADINLKENALSKLYEPTCNNTFKKYKPNSDILNFLNTL